MSKYVFNVYTYGYGGKESVLYASTRSEFMNLFEKKYRIVLGNYCKRERGYIVVGIRPHGIKYPFGWVNKKRGLRLPKFDIEFTHKHLYG